MTFDIHQLDEIDSYSAEGEDAQYAYQDDLIALFYDSPEGQKHLESYPDIGFWAAQLIYYGYGYLGVTIPQMTVPDVDQIITNLFPRKISLSSPDDAKDTLPELIAFWEYLKRAYMLPKANAILKYLRVIKPDVFVEMMNDSSRFGMAKSFFMAGQSAGFEMTDEKEMNTFMHLYNAAQIADGEGLPALSGRGASRRKQDKAKEKRKRKAAKAASKRDRRRKRRK